MRAIITITIPSELIPEIERIRKEKDISRSAAVSYLIEKGLENEGGI